MEIINTYGNRKPVDPDDYAGPIGAYKNDETDILVELDFIKEFVISNPGNYVVVLYEKVDWE